MDEIALVKFENKVAAAFESRRIRGPIHLVGGNETQLIKLFNTFIPRDAWVISTWRSHYHALLHGVPEVRVMNEILSGRSMQLHFPEHRFLSSAIMGGGLSIACGIASGIDPTKSWVWCFVGDMAASSGAFFEAVNYATGHDLPISFVVEDNGLSTNTPTYEAWGLAADQWWKKQSKVHHYNYRRTQPHCGSGVYVAF